jgi:hypothetical protein
MSNNLPLKEVQQSLSSPSQSKGVQVEKLSKDIHLPIVIRSDKAQIPLMGVTR